MPSNQIILVVHNVRSAHNVGSMLRTCDGLGISKVYLTGFTPYPKKAHDTRLPHIAAKTERAIAKTSLGAEKNVKWRQASDVIKIVESLKSRHFTVAALEQTPSAADISTYQCPNNLALIVGNEVSGIDSEVLRVCDTHLQIPMRGKKESFNVSVAAAIALYQLGLGARV